MAPVTAAHLWYLYTGTDGPAIAGALAALHSQRFDLQRANGANADCEGGLVFFDEVEDTTCRAIHESTAGHCEPVLAVSLAAARLSLDGARRLLGSGAADVIAWRESGNTPLEIASRFDRWAAVEDIVDSPLVRENLVGRSPAWLRVLRRVAEVAAFTDAPVLLTGESGTGKELVARLVHSLSPLRRDRELIVLDCATVMPELSGSEFFGHERGAYTGAVGPRTGAFELAANGSLFLDEVGELPLGLQAQLLRAVQEKTYKPVGGNVWKKADFRLICATNRDLSEEVLQGRFRADLYYRLATWTCRLPALRERTEDIVPLSVHFLRAMRPDETTLDFDEPVRQFLIRRDYPGNVRDLRQTVARLAYRHVGPGPISAGAISDEDGLDIACDDTRLDDAFEQPVRRALELGASLKEIAHLATEAAVRIVVGQEDGSLQRAAKRLGVTDRALQLRRARGGNGTGSLSRQSLAVPTDPRSASDALPDA